MSFRRASCFRVARGGCCCCSSCCSSSAPRPAPPLRAALAGSAAALRFAAPAFLWKGQRPFPDVGLEPQNPNNASAAMAQILPIRFQEHLQVRRAAAPGREAGGKHSRLPPPGLRPTTGRWVGEGGVVVLEPTRVGENV